LDTGTKEDLEAKTKDLSDSLQKIGQAMSQQPGQPGAPKEEAASAGSSGEPKEEKKSNKEEPVEGEVVN